MSGKSYQSWKDTAGTGRDCPSRGWAGGRAIEREEN